MIATILMMGLKYDCNDSNNRDWIWLQFSIQSGSNIISMFARKGTKYECNLHSESNHIWLQSFSKRTKYDYNVEIRPWDTWLIVTSGQIPWKQNFDDCNHIWFFLKGIAIIYGRSRTEIAFILSPFCDQDCNHIWSS